MSNPYHVVPDDDDANLGIPESAAVRPERLRDIIGQPRLTEQLTTFLNSAVARHEQPGPILLDGGPGLGKTTIGQAISGELTDRGTTSRFHELAGEELKRKELIEALSKLRDGDILFMDEIQELQRRVQVTLYKAMEDGYIIVNGAPMYLPKFTLIGATTHSGKITAPLRDRFKFAGHIVPYAFDDMQLVLMSYAEHAGIDLSWDAAKVIAKASRYTPRLGIGLVGKVRDYAFKMTDDIDAKLDDETARQGLEFNGVDQYGLDDRDRRVLCAVTDEFFGGPIGLNPLATTLGMDPTELSKDIEPYLVKAGLLRHLPRGRAATRATYIVQGLPIPILINGFLR